MTTIAHHLPALQVIVPMLTAPLVMLLKPAGLARAAAIAASLFAFAIAIAMTMGVLDGHIYTYRMGSWPAPYGIELAVDRFSVLVLLIVTGASSFALLAGQRSVDADISHDRQPLFYSAWLLALAGLSGIPVSADAFNIFVFMEISSLASYVLIAGGSNRRALPAVFKYLIMGTIGATFYLIGIGLIYLMTGTLNLEDMAQRISGVEDVNPIIVAAGFVTVGLALKAAIFPLHVWLPNAYTYAPNTVTVFLAACGTKVSIYLLLRFDLAVFQGNLVEHAFHFAAFLMPLAVLGILVGSTVAMFEKDIKRLLAYSSIAQIGYILLGASLVTIAGLTASTLHIFNHALAKGTLFLAVACLATQCTGYRLSQLGGAAKKMPWTAGALVVSGFSLIGIPGTAGFISKWYLISAAYEQGSLGIALIVVLVISSLMAVVYIWRIVESIYFGEPTSDLSSVREAPIAMLVLTWAAALLNIYFGLVPELPVSLSSSAADILLGPTP
ncbi:MAG: monovalent cation/H+ antiporter subunit D family protein [Woeseiaceae bacterium]|nr:monovalent cation/H+ antiporter subunit D family protein [Woeseiaceae bacterium]